MLARLPTPVFAALLGLCFAALVQAGAMLWRVFA